MAVLTPDLVVDRVRSLLVAAPFHLHEADSPYDFDSTPDTLIDETFRIPPPALIGTLGQTGFREERTDALTVYVARQANGDHTAMRRTLLTTAHSITAAVVRDGAVSSGDYYVPDGGRQVPEVQADRTRSYLLLRVTLPVAYDTSL